MSNDTNQIVMEDQTCAAIGYQSVSICVPVTVTPIAYAGATHTKCCGCCGCEITITQ